MANDKGLDDDPADPVLADRAAEHDARLQEAEAQEAAHHATPGRPERPDDEGPAQWQTEPPHA